MPVLHTPGCFLFSCRGYRSCGSTFPVRPQPVCTMKTEPSLLLFPLQQQKVWYIILDISEIGRAEGGREPDIAIVPILRMPCAANLSE